MSEHAYDNPRVVGRKGMAPSEEVLRKAFTTAMGITYKGRSPTTGVMHFEVLSSSGNTYRVEYDPINDTFLCSCPWGFYMPKSDTACSHIVAVSDIIPWT